MSDNSASSNSWTMLTPEANEAVVENVGPLDGESGSLADVPSHSEEVTGCVAEPRTSDRGTSTDCSHSEEGLQVCQETAPEESQGSAPPSPTLLTPSPTSHLPLLSDLGSYCSTRAEVQTHEVSNLETGSHTPPNAYLDAYSHAGLSERPTNVGMCPESSVSMPTSVRGAEKERSDVVKKASEVGKQAGAETLYDSELGDQEPTNRDTLRKRRVHLLNPLNRGEKQADEKDDDEEELRPVDRAQEGSTLSLNKCIVVALILLALGTLLFSEENIEVRELKESDRAISQDWLLSPAHDASLNVEMNQLLDKLAQEDLRISTLQTQLQEKTEELNLALQWAEIGGKELEKENERMRMELSSVPHLQRELESLRARLIELTQIMAQEESTQVPDSGSVAPSPGQTDNKNTNTVMRNSEEVDEATTHKSDMLINEMERQKVLLQESRGRLEGMQVEGREEERVREELAHMERRLAEQGEKLGRKGGYRKKEGNVGKGDGWRPDPKEWHEGGGRKQWRGENEWKLEKDGWKGNDKDWRGKDEKKEWRGEKDWRKDKNDKWESGKHWVNDKELRGQKDGEQWNDGEQGKIWKHREEKREWPKDEDRKQESWKDMRHGEWKNHKDNQKHGEGPERNEQEQNWRDMRHGEWKNQKDNQKHGEGPESKEQEQNWKDMRHGEWKNHKDNQKHGEGPERKEQEEHGSDGNQRQRATKTRHWHVTVDKTPLETTQQHHEHNEYWNQKKQKLRNYYRPLASCGDTVACARTEGLVPVTLTEFEALLGGYLSKLDESQFGGREQIISLVRDFFTDGVFSHDKMSFRDFVEDLAEILEDMVEGEGSDEMEEMMEEFEETTLSKFILEGTEERHEGSWRREKGRVRV